MGLKSPLIDAKELATRTAGDTLVVDCRFELAHPAQGERDYLAGHVPGAVYANLDCDLSDLSRKDEGLGRHPLPHAQDFAARLGAWGWRAGMALVAYDAGNGAMAAARLWWLARLAGIADAVVLDGGFAAWRALGLPVQTEVPVCQSTQVRLAYDEDAVVLAPSVLSAQDAFLLIDARAAARFRGDEEPLDRVAGHVPGARNRPFTENLATDGRFKPAATLRAEFAELLGRRDPSQVVLMCGSGVTACHHALAMAQAGLPGARLYAPSWSGWCSDPARPVATGG